jgi:hypothetical protein
MLGGAFSSPVAKFGYLDRTSRPPRPPRSTRTSRGSERVYPPRFSVNGRDNENVVCAIAPSLKTRPPTCRRILADINGFWLKDSG